MKKILLLFVLVWGVGVSCGQDSGELTVPGVIPPSPEVASLLEFNHSKANEYSGGVSASIPLYAIRKGDINIPISISYHSTGHEIDKVSSQIGMGWSLNAGGVVGRTILGGADEQVYGYSDERIAAAISYDFNCINEEYDLLKRLSNGTADAESDTYTFSIPGGTNGSLTFDRDGIMRQFEKTGISIHAIGSNQEEWKVVDEHGTSYYFREKEKVFSMNISQEMTPNSANNDPSTYSSWHLSEIISSNLKDTVWFDYINSTQEYVLSPIDEFYEPLIAGNEDDKITTITISTQKSRPMSSYSQYMYFMPKLITRIRTNWGVELEFIRDINNKRLDVKGDSYQLQKVIVKNNQKTVTSWNLEQSYFKSKKDGVELSGYNPDFYRLRLDQVCQTGSDGVNMPPYLFTYFDNGNYPKRASREKDYWGYYNGKKNIIALPLYDEELEGIVWANRFPNKEMTKQGVLQKIDYPNGGSVEYEYELNDIPNVESQPHKTETYEYLSRGTEGESAIELIIDSPYGNSDILVEYVNSYIESDSDNGETIGDIVGDESENSIRHVELSISGNNFPTYYLLPDAPINQVVNLPNGVYSVKIKILDNQRIDGPSRIDIKRYTYSTPKANLNVGGLRVAKEIRTSGTGDDLEKHYKYVAEDGSSSGISFKELVFKYREIYTNASPHSSAIACFRSSIWGYTVFKSEALQPLGVSLNSPIGYSRVIEEGRNIENGSVIGKTISHFINEKKLNGEQGAGTGWLVNKNFGKFATPYWGSKHNGILANQEVYNKSDRLISKSDFSYEPLVSPKKVYNMRVRQYMYPSNCEGCEYNKFEVGLYRHTTESLFKLIKEKNSIFTDDGKVLTTEKEYTYDTSNGHLTRSFTRGSEGILDDPVRGNYTTLNSQLVSYKYPKDLASIGNVYYQMLAKNILSTPVEVETRSTGGAGAINIQKTNYQIIGENILPESINTKHGDNPEETRIQYHAYDLNGNPLEFSKTDDIRTSILWDENRLRPIAKAVNASHNEIWHTSFEEDGDGIDGGWTGNKSKENPILDIPSLPVGQYLFSYWQENAEGIWNLVEENLSNTEIATKTLTGKVDEIRVHPIDAQMSTITYDEAGRTLTKCDANGHTVRYHYDGFGRLQHIKDEWGNVVKAYDYKYHNE
jgi:YD repeat-containing protein